MSKVKKRCAVSGDPCLAGTAEVVSRMVQLGGPTTKISNKLDALSIGMDGVEEDALLKVGAKEKAKVHRSTCREIREVGPKELLIARVTEPGNMPDEALFGRRCQ